MWFRVQSHCLASWASVHIYIYVCMCRCMYVCFYLYFHSDVHLCSIRILLQFSALMYKDQWKVRKGWQQEEHPIVENYLKMFHPIHDSIRKNKNKCKTMMKMIKCLIWGKIWLLCFCGWLQPHTGWPKVLTR